MSFREEQDKRKNNKSSGLGLAAAAIGVGVGAALYYLFSKRTEVPDSEGATSSNWSCEEPQSFLAFNPARCNVTSDSDKMDTDETTDSGSDTDSESDYTTTSEHTTTDTSMEPTSEISDHPNNLSLEQPIEWFSQTDPESDTSNGGTIEDASHVTIDDSIVTISSGVDLETDWDVTTSLNVPQASNRNISPFREVLQAINAMWSPMNMIRSRARSWSLEECSICCDIMLKDQAIMSLPCTHKFHEACIQPWLQMNEQQTCPNCRKMAA